MNKSYDYVPQSPLKFKDATPTIKELGLSKRPDVKFKYDDKFSTLSKLAPSTTRNSIKVLEFDISNICHRIQ